MNNPAKVTFLLSLCLLFITGCSRLILQAQPVLDNESKPLLEPGNKINNMVITKGADEAVPLWAFCLPTVESSNLITVDCPELSYPRLAIGYTFGLMDLVPKSFDWSEMTWEMDLDDQPVDLLAFGTHDFILPDLGFSPSPIREVFRKMTVWDVVLVNAKPGQHTLRGVGKTGADSYTWLVDFSIADPPGY